MGSALLGIAGGYFDSFSEFVLAGGDRAFWLELGGSGGVFGDQAVAAAMIDRILHHADLPHPESASTLGLRLGGDLRERVPGSMVQAPPAQRETEVLLARH